MTYFRLRDQTNVGTKNIKTKNRSNVLTAKFKRILTLSH